MKSSVRHIKKYSPFVNRPKLEGEAAISQLASDFRDLVASEGGVTADDLLTLGWPQAAVDRHGAKARERAMTQSAG